MAFDYMKFMCDKKATEYAKSLYKEEYHGIIKEEIMLPMKDGVRLRTILYKPAMKDQEIVTSKLPVILQRTCYPEHERMIELDGEKLAKRGYVFVSQFCRGTGGSEGEWEPNVNERADGMDTMKWLDEQDWVDSIGYWGNSYLALTGWAIADVVPDKVKGMCLTHYGTDRFKSAYEKGMFRQDVLTSWTMDNAGFKIHADYMESCKFMPQIEVDEKLWGKRIDWYREWITNTDRENDYWQQGWWKQLYNIPEKVKVPLYIRSGWYDHHHGSSMNTWNHLREETKQHCWLDIGAWNHAFLPCMEDCKTDHLNGSEVHAILEWFDLILKKKRVPESRIRTYMTGADQWLELPHWPFDENAYKTLYLDVTQGENEQTLTEKTTGEEGHLCYQYDPLDPVVSHGSEALLKNMMKNGSLLQPEPGYRQDVLSFVSEPLNQDLWIMGKIKVKLFVSTDCPDTAFTAKLMEVRSDNKSYNIRSSITTIGKDINGTYEPGTVKQVTIDMWDIAYEVKKGSRLRVDISSSDFPQYNIHSNFAGIWSLQGQTQKAQQKVYFGKKYPSVIEIPYMKNETKEG